jgi:hypothetical protein
MKRMKAKSSIGIPIIAPIMVSVKMKPRNPRRIAAIRMPALKASLHLTPHYS